MAEKLFQRWARRKENTFGAKANDKLDLKEYTRVFSEPSLAGEEGEVKRQLSMTSRTLAGDIVINELVEPYPA